MKILLLSTELTTPDRPQGGLANSVERLARALAERGHETRTLSYGEQHHSEWRGKVLTEWVPVPCPRWRLALNYATFLRFATIHTALIRARALARRARELQALGKVDLVHYANLNGIGLCLPRTLPTICRISSDTLLWKQMGAFESVSEHRLRQRAFLERRSLLRARTIYAPSQRLAVVAQKECGRKIDVIPTPIFAETDSRRENPESGKQKKPFLLFVGALNALKGIEEIGAILPGLLGRKRELRFIFAGPEGSRVSGPSWKNWLRNCAREDSDRLVFPGPVSHEELYPLYRQAEAVVLPSRVDNLPNTMLEAMYHGGIVIGTRNASFDEVISDGENGFLCKSENPASLLEAIDRVLNLEDRAREKVREKAQTRMKSYSPKEILPHLEKLFLDAISDGTQRGQQQ